MEATSYFMCGAFILAAITLVFAIIRIKPHNCTGCLFLIITRKSPEAVVFKKRYAQLQVAIPTPEAVANKLFSKEMISSRVKEEVQCSAFAIGRKCEILLGAIEREIGADARNFYKFTDILHEEPATEKLAYQLLRDVTTCAQSAGDFIRSIGMFSSANYLAISSVVAAILLTILDLLILNVGLAPYSIAVGFALSGLLYWSMSTRSPPFKNGQKTNNEFSGLSKSVQVFGVEKHHSKGQHKTEMVRSLPLVKYKKTTQFRKTECSFIESLLSNDAKRVDEMATKILNSSKITLDIKVIAECYQASSKATFRGQEDDAEPLFVSALAKASQLKCANGLILQARVLRHHATLLRAQGKYEKADELLLAAKERLFSTEHSFDKAAVLLQDIQLRLERKPKQLGKKMQQEIEKMYDIVIICMDAFEKHEEAGICICLIRKAAFHLRSSDIDEELPTEACRPTPEDLTKAEMCFQRVPLEVLPSEVNYYTAEYYLTQSDLYLWKEEYPKAIKYAKQAKEHFIQGKITNERSDIPKQRLRLLKRLEAHKTEGDMELDQILEMFTQ